MLIIFIYISQPFFVISYFSTDKACGFHFYCSGLLLHWLRAFSSFWYIQKLSFISTHKSYWFTCYNRCQLQLFRHAMNTEKNFWHIIVVWYFITISPIYTHEKLPIYKLWQTNPWWWNDFNIQHVYFTLIPFPNISYIRHKIIIVMLLFYMSD